ncbi:hypothetical protein CE143_20535 [Photorhabdus luminescens]|uniref:Uncharacterized protein n=2 Tax=Photorhabdus TaxID=29487 RepID=A0A022PG78_9GAMM|nr:MULTISPECIES: hypothetical protein [Photorhabdus]EYU14544.1 hypothetical protein BA1DRAFT_02913 [Photorhabdus aegyptia]MBS9429919.1 hypothetical protein [Photorhabdus akhurstii]QXF35293.1 hypothetical protein B0X70_20490 [Photorhabdus akhurstii]UJD77124.1 hypothetical protein CE143_20535 [Photorhabdus luminescens]
MKLIKILILLSPTLFISQTALALSHPLTPENITKEIINRGTNSVVAELGEMGARQEITHKITTGDRKWIKLAFKLTQSMHQDFAKEIRYALSLALINNPVEVLANADKENNLSLADICTIPPELGTRENKIEFIDKVKKSLGAITDSKAKDRANDCFWELEKAYNTEF